MTNRDEVLLEGVTIKYPNFAGEKTKFKAAGNKEFAVIVDPAGAQTLASLGYPVKYVEPKELEDGTVLEGYHILRVGVKYEFKPPQVVTIGGTTGIRTTLDDEAIGILDDMEYENVDLVIRPYDYDFNGNQGRKAMLKKMYVTVVEDYLDLKYAARQED